MLGNLWFWFLRGLSGVSAAQFLHGFVVSVFGIWGFGACGFKE